MYHLSDEGSQLDKPLSTNPVSSLQLFHPIVDEIRHLDLHLAADLERFVELSRAFAVHLDGVSLADARGNAETERYLQNVINNMNR